MDALIYFLLWGALIFLVMRMGCGAHVAGRGPDRPGGGEDGTSTSGLRWVPPETDIDPVCRKTVRTENARSSVHDGLVYYFCSRECREIFEAAPDEYTSARAEAPAGLLGRAHD